MLKSNEITILNKLKHEIELHILVKGLIDHNSKVNEDDKTTKYLHKLE